MRTLFLVLVTALVAGLLPRGWAGPVESPVRVKRVFEQLKFKRPTYLTYLPDGSGRLVVLEQAGRVSWFQPSPDVQQAEVALDISGRVRREGNEEGLLGLAFHPGFAENRQLFLMYSASRPRRNVLSRFRMDESRQKILEDSEEVLLEVGQPYGNHNGGMIEFGPDGFLYVSLGDGGAYADLAENSQNKATLLGAILRLDVDHPTKERPYGIPPDNPLVGKPGVREELWAWGLRNVWRFSFDRKTGDLWGGDVGQWEWEEIDLIEKGRNYGWNMREGFHLFHNKRDADWRPSDTGGEELVDPIVEHPVKEAQSITGGYVYRGTRFPSLNGAYIYADYVKDNVWMLRYDGEKVTEHHRFDKVPAVASFGEDAEGELYLVSLSGKIYTLVPRDE